MGATPCEMHVCRTSRMRPRNASESVPLPRPLHPSPGKLLKVGPLSALHKIGLWNLLLEPFRPRGPLSIKVCPPECFFFPVGPLETLRTKCAGGAAGLRCLPHRVRTRASSRLQSGGSDRGVCRRCAPASCLPRWDWGFAALHRIWVSPKAHSGSGWPGLKRGLTFFDDKGPILCIFLASLSPIVSAQPGDPPQRRSDRHLRRGRYTAVGQLPSPSHHWCLPWETVTPETCEAFIA